MATKNSKIAIISVIIFIVLNSSIYFFAKNNISTLDKIENGKIETMSALPEEYNTFKIQLNDYIYNMPISIDKITDLGFFSNVDYSNNEINSHSFTLETYQYFSAPGLSSIEIGFYNASDDAKKVKDCYISSVTIERGKIMDDSIRIVFPGGIQLGSTYQKAHKVYGNATESYKGKDYISYTWQVDNQNYVKAYVKNSTQKIYKLTMQKI